MQEIEYYSGTHTGQEIDAAVEKSLYPRLTNPVGSADDYTDSDLASIAIVAVTLTQEIVQFIGTLNLNGDSYWQWTWTAPSPGSPTDVNITAQHVPVRVEFSNPSVICGDYTLVTGDNSVTFSGAGYGTTDITITMARQLGSAIDKR